MKIYDKIQLFEELNSEEILRVERFYDVLEKCCTLKNDYHKYMTTAPINCDKELQRVSSSDYDLCCALLTMLLREDHFGNGSFERRQCLGQVKPIVERIIKLLTSKYKKHINGFSEKAMVALNGFYVYALVDPRDDKVFYIGKGSGNRVFFTNWKVENDKIQKRQNYKRLEKSKVVAIM